MTINLPITLNIPVSILAEALCTALENGSGYWLSWDGSVEGDLGALPVDDELLVRYLRVFGVCGRLYGFQEHGGDRGTGPYLSLNVDQIQKGLVLMASQHPRMFAELISEDGDSNTADVFLQYCLLGEVRYG